MFIFPYHQVLFATAGNAVVTSAFVYIRRRVNKRNNNKQIWKSKNVSLGRENSVSNATFRTPGSMLSAPSHVYRSYYVQQDTWSILSNVRVCIPVLQNHSYFHYRHPCANLSCIFCALYTGSFFFIVGLSWTDISRNARVIYSFVTTMLSAAVNRRLSCKKNPLCVIQIIMYTV
jgi:hypothetical protein